MDDHRAGDDGDASAGLLHLAHHQRDARHAAFYAPLRRDVVAHEGEAKTIALAEFGGHADAVVPAHDRLTRLDIAQLPAFGLAAGGDDDRIHPLLLDFDPLALEADVRTMVGR